MFMQPANFKQFFSHFSGTVEDIMLNFWSKTVFYKPCST